MNKPLQRELSEEEALRTNDERASGSGPISDTFGGCISK